MNDIWRGFSILMACFVAGTAMIVSVFSLHSVSTFQGQVLKLEKLLESDHIGTIDSVEYAASLGRLDVVSLVLALLGLLLVVTAVPVFLLIKGSAIDAAKDEAEETAKKCAPECVSKWMIDEGRTVIEAQVETYFSTPNGFQTLSYTLGSLGLDRPNSNDDGTGIVGGLDDDEAQRT